MIEAAGGVVLRKAKKGLEVLVVHRVRHDDWSLPKGKLDPGESPEDAALREVVEETGVKATLGRQLTTSRYRTPAGPKRVRWYLMAPRKGNPAKRLPDGEVDVARYVPVKDALTLLTYAHEAVVLRDALEDAAS